MRDNSQGLAYVVEVLATEAIPNKDRIVFAINNKNNLKATINKADLDKDDLYVFFEVDTLIPDNYFGDKAFLNEKFKFLEGSKKQNYHYYHIHARKMQDCISMGLIIPLSELIDDKKLEKTIRATYRLQGNMDLTKFFELEKYEPPIPNSEASCLEFYNALYHGEKTFNKIPTIGYPVQLTDKSDEENLFNISEEDFKSHLDDKCYATIKVDGMSTTFYIKDGIYYILGHNCMSYVPQLYKWTAENNIFDKMKEYTDKTKKDLLVCGEFFGPKIQKNPYNLKDHKFYCYKMVAYNDKESYTMGYDELRDTCKEYEIDIVKPAWTPAPLTLRTFADTYTLLDNIEQVDYKKILDGFQEMTDGMTYQNGNFDKCSFTKEGELHEGIVVTSVDGHKSNANNSKGWSFKIKSLPYQERH